MPKGEYPRPSVEERFWKSVKKELGKGCWNWTAAKICGYGAFSALGEQRAHRVAYRLFVGEIPEGLYVLHKCDNPKCIRPDHLFLGTQQDNVDDKVAKGRQSRLGPNGNAATGDQHGSRTKPECRPRGERHGLRIHPELAARGEKIGVSKLTVSLVREIRTIYEQRIMDQKQLAQEYGVCQRTINCVVNRITWKHVN